MPRTTPGTGTLIALLGFGLVVAGMASAVTVTVTGAAGSAGGPGQDGGAGQTVEAIAASTDNSNTAQATGGTGGTSGSGATGGAGGDAVATAATTSAANSAGAIASATGGRGGHGTPFGIPGTGAQGGDAVAGGELSYSGIGSAGVTATATGGQGGDGGASGGGGGDGGSAMLAPSTLLNVGGAPQARASYSGTIRGGTGGRAYSLAPAGAGADALLDGLPANFVNFQHGNVDLSLYGGSGGTSESGTAGSGGRGWLNLGALPGVPSLFLRATVHGGNGGSRLLGAGRAADGGAGEVLLDTVWAGIDGNLRLTARGGGGGSGSAGSAGGDGGDGVASGSLLSTGTAARIQLSLRAEGGASGLAHGGQGIASTTLYETNAGAQRLDGEAVAVGGAGGAATVAGAGGAGGAATATSTVLALGSANVISRAVATGGAGGVGRGVSHSGGAGGTATASASGHGQGFVSVETVAIAGAGGSGAAGASAGAGGDQMLIDNVSGSSAERLTLTQRATGGRGGAGGGRGGHALSALTPGIANSAGGKLVVNLYATGGEGGGSAASAHGGNAHAESDVTGHGDVALVLQAQAGRAGSADADVGVATVTGRAVSLAGGAVSVDAIATGAEGASANLGGTGNGGAVVLIDTITADTSGAISLTQRALGGRGGTFSASTAPAGGQGGDAVSRLSRTALSAAALSVTAEARGGDSTSVSATGVGPLSAGQADALAVAENLAGAATAQAYATGGRTNATDGVDSATSAQAQAITHGDGHAVKAVANANATATGGVTFRNSINEAHASGIAHGNSAVDVSALARGAYADVSAFGRNAGDAPVDVSAFAAGGKAAAAQPGQVPTISARGESPSGAVTVEVDLTAGSGGYGQGAALPGAAGSVALHDVAQGSTAGSLTLVQKVRAGDGGGAQTAPGAAGGTAASSLQVLDGDGGATSGTAQAVGGAGGASGGGPGGTGGSAHAEVDVSVRDTATATALAIGGTAGYSGAGTPTVGGSAVARATAHSVQSTASASAVQAGGGGGRGMSSGADGAASVLIDAVSGAAPLVLSLHQEAWAGGGGSAIAGSAQAGRGGNAESRIDATNPGGGGLTVDLVARGGAGGGLDAGGTLEADARAGHGGDAHAAGRAVAAGPVDLNVTAHAGSGGWAQYSGGGGDGGTATVGEVFGRSTTDEAVRVAVELFGGDGGVARGGVAGHGSDAHLIDVAEGETAGALTLAQTAAGGIGGDTWDSGSTAGRGGAASSEITGTRSVTVLDVATRAIAGYGGEGSFEHRGGDGGSAETRVDIGNLTGAARGSAVAEAGGGGFAWSPELYGTAGTALAEANVFARDRAAASARAVAAGNGTWPTGATASVAHAGALSTAGGPASALSELWTEGQGSATAAAESRLPGGVGPVSAVRAVQTSDHAQGIVAAGASFGTVQLDLGSEASWFTNSAVEAVALPELPTVAHFLGPDASAATHLFDVALGAGAFEFLIGPLETALPSALPPRVAAQVSFDIDGSSFASTDPFGILFGGAESSLPWGSDPGGEFSELAVSVTLGEITLMTLSIPDLAGALSLFGGSFLSLGEAGLLFGGGTATLTVAVDAAAGDYEPAALSFGYALGTTQARAAVQVPVPFAWQLMGAMLMILIAACLEQRSRPVRASTA